MTSPSCPVTSIFCFYERYNMASTVSTLPPIWVQAIPLTTPIPFHNSLCVNFPKYYYTFYLLIVSFVPFLATFLQILDIFLSNSLTPSYLEYLTIYLSPSRSNSTSPSTPFSLICKGTKWFWAISIFYYLLYPGTSISSNLLRRGVESSSEFAVQMNITLERSTGMET